MLLVALALSFVTKASAQEWIYGIGYEINGDTAVYLRDIWPKPDNGYIVSGHIAVEPEHYSGQPMLVSLSPDGTELDRKIYFKPFFMGSWPSVVFNNKEGVAYALMAYQPDNDPNSPNYFLNSPNPPDYAILGLYKLDEHLEIVESHETQFQVDTALYLYDFPFPNCFTGRLSLIAAEQEGEAIVGSYVKSPTYDNNNPRGHDTIFFFRMGFDGHFSRRVGYEMESVGGGMFANWLQYQLVKVNGGYVFYYNDAPRIYYSSGDGQTRPGTPGTALVMDDDFVILGENAFHQQPNIYFGDHFQQLSVVRSNHNSVYASALFQKPNGYGIQGISLYEYGDPVDKGTLPLLRYIERSSGPRNWDKSAILKGVDIGPDNSIYFGYVLHPDQAVLCIDRLDPNFDTIRTWTFDDVGGGYIKPYYELSCIKTDNDDGLLVVYTTIEYNASVGKRCVMKISAEDFVAVKESTVSFASLHPNPTNGLVAIAGENLKAAEAFNALGQRVATATGKGELLQIDLSGLPAGVYFVNVTDSEGRKCVRKVVKE